MSDSPFSGERVRRTPAATRRIEDFRARAGASPRRRICVVIGTRPEAIKLAPVIAELERRADQFELFTVTTAQHREMLAQALAVFGIHPQVDLGLMHARQSLADFTARALTALSDCFTELRPDLVIVQGDTTTVLAASLAAAYLQIPVAHVEAGLRSGNLRNPFPEELNRRIATIACELHFAPTEVARRNLLLEGVAPERIVVTGNTIVDAVQAVAPRHTFEEPRLNALPWHAGPVILTTVHRRESFGGPLEDVCGALRDLAGRHPELRILFPVHLNPRVREVVFAHLEGTPGITLLPPLSYPDLLEVVRRSTFVMTDSGGIQEECPALRKPVLIMRENTERPEVTSSGFGRLVGTDRRRIVAAATRLLASPAERAEMSAGANPFGDGQAARRIVDAIAERLAVPPADRTPPTLPPSPLAAPLGAAHAGAR